MKELDYKRVDIPDGVKLCDMDFVKGPAVVLNFGKKQGGKIKLPIAFLADAVEHYLTHIIKLGIEGETNAIEIGKIKSRNKRKHC